MTTTTAGGMDAVAPRVGGPSLNPQIKRIFHPYHLWEETAAGMWRIVTGDARKPYLAAAAALMRNPEAFKAAMMRAVNEWRFSCEANLSARSVNRQAWLGHAGCCIATGSPEDITRQAWWTLNQSEQDEANRVADECILAWEKLHLSRLAKSLASDAA